MKLLDFKSSKELNELREKMDAPYQEWSAFEWDKLDADSLLEKLRSSEGILLEDEDLEELNIDDEDLFKYKGQRVLVYIRDQFFNPKYPDREYKYHICSCPKIDEMFQSGRKNRYVVTKNTSGNFKVRVINKFTNEVKYQGKRQMNVCKLCLLHLVYGGYDDHRKQSNKDIYSKFSLEEFFDRYSATKHNKLPDFDENTAPKNEYSKDFGEISTQYRKKVDWKCEECGIDLTNDKRLLHLHHINGIRSDNSPSNLTALCIRCHAEKNGHEDLKFNPDYKRFLEKYGD